MHRVTETLIVLGVGGGLLPLVLAAQHPNERPLRPEGFSAHAIILPPRRIGDTVIRASSAVAVEIRLRIRGYLPRNMEPVLLIDGARAEAASGVVQVEGDVTTIGFVVEQPEALREGATLAVQMGDAAATRGRVPGVLRRSAIRPLDENEARRLGLPSLTEWLRGVKPNP